MTPQEYRNKHHRCKGCKYKKLIQPPPGVCSDYYKCSVKDKYIPEFDIFNNGRGCFCEVYKAKLGTDED